ncbi:glycoside hydrolase family 16 protein [Adhaeribacter arboris]|uniref:Glycoside hydrolase family 16 protein n=1 Tax=Adhaeribacter arboris TaxID=2072846 RepID=A0A2T2YCD2_9BACT|nr:glycoside hydrolase family 16 protein [Adhaeribacter arboris]PSR53175.1 glycoside hydrolase family 16 protein [Adhaeribacter arboris]
MIVSKNKLVLTGFILLGSISVYAQATKIKSAQPKASNQKVVFFDDFSGSKLDRSKWNVVVTGFHVNNEQQAYVDSSATLYISHKTEAAGANKGVLVIEPKYSPGFVTKDGKKFDFLSGRMDTRKKVEFQYGTASARMKLPEGAGFWPAFWAMGDGKWPDIGEIDIMENVGEPDWTGIALHGPGYSGETPLVNKGFLKPGNDITKWHVYSVDWTKDSLVFKVDDAIVYRATRPMVEHYGKWSFDNPKYLIVNLALGGAYPFKTNGVKTPYNGIPEATVQKIKDGQGKVLVDWVKVTKR